MVEGLKHVKDLWVLVEELPREGGATAGGCKEQDVFPRCFSRHRTVIAQASPPDVLNRRVTRF